MGFSSGLVVGYWPLAVAFIASAALVAAMFFRVSAAEPPHVEPPLSWSDAVRVCGPAPAGAGCSVRSW